MGIREYFLTFIANVYQVFEDVVVGIFAGKYHTLEVNVGLL